MQRILRGRKSEGGFTLVELLIVIVILGIIAAVVVFATQGLTDRGQLSSCKADAKILRTAQEAYYNQQTPKAYAADAAALRDEGLLTEISDYHTTAGEDTAADVETTQFDSYTITPINDCAPLATDGDYTP